MAFREAIIESVKEESMLLCRKGWELSSAPLPAHYLKRGYLTKRGHSVSQNFPVSVAVIIENLICCLN